MPISFLRPDIAFIVIFLALSSIICSSHQVCPAIAMSFFDATLGIQQLHNATTMTATDNEAGSSIPILLLKTKSTPNDGYEERFSTAKIGSNKFDPTFVPVLEHQFLDQGLDVVKDLLRNKQIGKDEGKKYGGMIFTSQRAVEAFARLVEEGKGANLETNELSEQTSLINWDRRCAMALSTGCSIIHRWTCHLPSPPSNSTGSTAQYIRC
mgnify:CR=1 FL=1